MWYRDIVEKGPSVVADYFDCSDEAAEVIGKACAIFYDCGTKGMRPLVIGPETRSDRTPWREYAADLSIHIDDGEPADPDDLGDLFRDAWVEGLGLRSRLTIKLVPREGSFQCHECEGTSYDVRGVEWPSHPDVTHDAAICEACGAWQPLEYYAEVSGPYVNEWCDAQGSLDGGTWETPDGNTFAYDIVTDRPDLVDELRGEGYVLDLSDY